MTDDDLERLCRAVCHAHGRDPDMKQLPGGVVREWQAHRMDVITIVAVLQQLVHPTTLQRLNAFSDRTLAPKGGETPPAVPLTTKDTRV